MILGNSNGNNKGKKYMTRGKFQDIELTASDYVRLEEFNKWYVKHCKSLKSFFISNNCYNEDTLTDTYLRTCENILYVRINIQCYKSYFCRSYYTNYILLSKKESRYCDLDISLKASKLDESESYIEQMIAEDKLYNDIVKYVKENYPANESKAFIMHMTDYRFNQEDIGKYLGIQTHQIQRLVVKMKDEIKNIFIKRKQSLNQ